MRLPVPNGRASIAWQSLGAALLLAGACLNPNETDPAAEGRRLSVGAITACALDPTGNVFCWGSNSSFLEYGTASLQTSGSPVSVGGPRLAWISGGWGQHKCG